MAASLIVVPLMMPDNKLLWTLGAFTASLLLLLGVICIYTHGRWFFVASTSVLLGFSVCLLPPAVYTRPLRVLLGRQKGLTVMAASTLFFWLMMLSIGLYVRSGEFWRIASAISLPILALIWLLFLLIRYAKIGGLFKADICTGIVGVFSFFVDSFIGRCLGTERPLPVFRPFIWKVSTLDGNLKWLLLLTCALACVVLLVLGFIRGGKGKG